MNGLALKIEDEGFTSAKRIMELHREKLQECGKVYFSTDVSIAQKMAGGIEYILFFNKRRKMFYLAHVCKIELNKKIGERDTSANVFIPNDSKEYAVEEYAYEKKKTWILIDELDELTDVETLLRKWKTLNEGISVFDKIDVGGRFPRFYFVG